jgi:guanosine-3',5'-bis(diphosphate) 3'-pyrophosphohydrolase
MIRLNDITSQILSYHPKANIELVEKAYVYSAKVHQGQIRLSGEPYLSHPLEVAYILTKMKMDVTCIAAGFLHDTLEDTEAEPDEIKHLFGEETANIVEGVTKISRMQFTNRQQRQAENVRKMILAMSSDIRVILVKLADRLHNMRTLGFQTPEKQRLIAAETEDIYAPLAGRMGIQWIKSSLEDLCLYYLEPKIYEDIKNEVAQTRDQREEFIKKIIELVSKQLEEFKIQATIKGRDKHFYSIYKKMLDQDLTVNQVYDVLAFRVIVSSIKECYEVLGHIHSMWKPVQGRFKDYISVPKANMYQSLHTTVIGPIGQRMEVQIRTWDMDKVAEDGIAAHWKYKDGTTANKTDEKQFMWLRQLLEWQQNLKDPAEFLETVRMDLFPDEVYVFTPRGDVKAFPRGATPVDFAYSIHSEVGDWSED